jgi:sugar transferase EpsL
MKKRFFDLLVSILILIILTPVFLLTYLMVRVMMGSPVIFSQMRPGLNEKPFRLYKFRSMKNVFDINGNLLNDALRLDRFGKFLRASSLDELPALWNVIKGDMSLVGPRPLLIEYLPLYNERQARRHEVKPGITGLAQINGRNAISWEDKFVLDIWYVDHRSFWLDVKILLITIKKVLMRDGVSEMGEATMSKFTGNKK